MSQAIWILKYELADGLEYQYLDWFHTIHIPEKLARPGYLWAAHFEGDVNTLNKNGSKKTYLALFGGKSTRTFLDPSPSELKNMQDDLTREMMANRRSSEGTIYTLEWSADGLNNVRQPNAEKLDYFSISANGNDEAVGAWAAQSLFPPAQEPDFNRSRTYKLISVTGNQKHGIIHHCSTHETVSSNKKGLKLQDPKFVNGIIIEHFTGRRIWPSKNGQ